MLGVRVPSVRKAIVYDDLVANTFVLQTVADQAQALQEPRPRGIAISADGSDSLPHQPCEAIPRVPFDWEGGPEAADP